MALTRVGGAVKSDRIFNTVAAMVASKTVKVGDVVETAGYTTIADGGGARYEIVAAATGTDDGGSFIDLDTHQAKLIRDADIVRASQFGCIDAADASTNIANLVTYAKTLTRPHIKIDCDLTTASTLTFDVPDESTIEFTGAVSTTVSAAPAIQIGGDSLNVSRVKVTGIKVQRTSNDTAGSSIGVRLHSLVWCSVEVIESTGFVDGVLCDGIEGNGGFSYNSLYLGRIHDNVTNLRMTASGAGGYCNDNNIYGGSFNHSSGYPAVNTTNYKIDHFATNRLNNNRLFGPSFEDNSTLAKAADISGDNNVIYHPRFERSVSQGTYEIEFTSNSSECAIIGKGFSVSKSNITDNGSNNHWQVRQGSQMSFQSAAIAGSTPVASDDIGLAIEGTASGSSCQLGVLNTSGALKFGVMGDGFVWSNQRVYAESGFRWSTSSGTADDRGLFAGSGSPEGSVTANPGSIYLNTAGGASTTLYVKESGGGNTGWVAK